MFGWGWLCLTLSSSCSGSGGWWTCCVGFEDWCAWSEELGDGVPVPQGAGNWGADAKVLSGACGWAGTEVLSIALGEASEDFLSIVMDSPLVRDPGQHFCCRIPCFSKGELFHYQPCLWNTKGVMSSNPREEMTCQGPVWWAYPGRGSLNIAAT